MTSHTKRTRQWTDRETISKKWAKELESDELKGQKKISVKIETHNALRDVAKTNESYDDIIGRLITFYKSTSIRNRRPWITKTRSSPMTASPRPIINRIHTMNYKLRDKMEP
ncbi:MAG: hypothetical protein ACR2IS_19440 [Nitrososphaeraceae archaeon]